MSRTEQRHFNWFQISSVCIVSLVWFLGPQSAFAVVAISTAGVSSNTTDYSASGLDIAGFDAGNLGYWFANFGTSSPETMQPVDQNDANGLPSWITVDFNPSNATTYSFSSAATSTGGQAGYNTLTLPDGTSGLSGQLVDNLNASGTSSSTLLTRWMFGPGVPSDFYLSVVLDNHGSATPPDGPTVVNRLRGSHRSAASPGSGPEATYDGLAAGANGTADVYTFFLTGAEVGGQFTVQLRTLGNVAATADTALAGVMFSGVPEPSSLILVLGGLFSYALLSRRRG